MFADPIKNLKQFGLREDMIVADLGAGTGFYSVAAARMLPKGKVYAVEVIKDYVTTIKNKAKELRLNNIECFWGDIEKLGGTKLKNGIVDAVICSNIFSQISDHDGLIAEIKRIIKPTGKIFFIEWVDGPSLVGPKQEKMFSKEKVVGMFEKIGFSLEREIDTGSHHYGMILINKKYERKF